MSDFATCPLGLGTDFLKPGLIPTGFGQKLQRLRRDRELGDYGYLLRVEPEAAEDVRIAREVLSALTQYLQLFLTG